MVHLLWARFGDEPDKLLLMNDVRLDEAKLIGTGGILPNPVEVLKGASRHNEAVYICTPRDKELCQVRPGKSSDPGDQRPHRDLQIYPQITQISSSQLGRSSCD